MEHPPPLGRAFWTLATYNAWRSVKIHAYPVNLLSTMYASRCTARNIPLPNAHHAKTNVAVRKGRELKGHLTSTKGAIKAQYSNCIQDHV
eukprot:1152982-Pelagomonas_calceolata.AAC.6